MRIESRRAAGIPKTGLDGRRRRNKIFSQIPKLEQKKPSQSKGNNEKKQNEHNQDEDYQEFTKQVEQGSTSQEQE